MSTRLSRRALAGAALVLPVLGIVAGGASAHPGSLRADAKQGPELAATVSTARAVNRDTSDRAPTVGETYPDGLVHSPLTPSVARHLRALAARGDLHEDVFAKVGASATVNRNFLRCFSGSHVDLAGREELEATLSHFRDGDPAAGWTDPFRRVSESATVGWHAGRALWGDPSPLISEIREIDPRFAVVMYGTNDIELNRPHMYARLISQLARTMTRRGVIPILTTIMPRDDDDESDTMVSLYNTILRGVAQRDRLPLIDYHHELAALPDHGLAGDRLHPNVRFVDGRPRGCDFSTEGMRYGYNIRNLLTLQALDRMRRHVLEDEPPPDAAAPAPEGAGSLGDPIQIGGLPFAHAGDTARSPHRLLDRYESCDAEQDESGAEYVYHLHLGEPARVYALVLDDDEVDVDIHRLELGPRGPRCVERGDNFLSHMDLPAGEHYFVVDTFVSADDEERSGEFLFVAARTDLPSDVDEAR